MSEDPKVGILGAMGRTGKGEGAMPEKERGVGMEVERLF